MTKITGNIDDFVEIHTMIKGYNDTIETSLCSSIQTIFETHLQETSHDTKELKEYGIDSYKLQIGDSFNITPTTWTKTLFKENNAPISELYAFKYKVVDIKIEFYSTNRKTEMEFPKIKIFIELDRE